MCGGLNPIQFESHPASIILHQSLPPRPDGFPDDYGFQYAFMYTSTEPITTNGPFVLLLTRADIGIEHAGPAEVDTHILVEKTA